MANIAMKVLHTVRDNDNLFWIYQFLEATGIHKTFADTWCKNNAKRDALSPTEGMNKSKEFFIANKDRIRLNLNLLADDESKSVYIRAIKFRCYGGLEYLPKESTLDEQYFGNDYFTYSPNEVFVDCGAFYGDTVQMFRKKLKSLGIITSQRNLGGVKIIAFEPDTQNFRRLKKHNPDIVCIEAGAWSSDTTLTFRNVVSSRSNSRLSSDTDGEVVEVKVYAIDNIPECRDATFIKMDIEGAEWDALHGAKETILRNKPKLAICIYHSDEDMLRLIELIHEWVPEYRLYVKHHNVNAAETVLYATI